VPEHWEPAGQASQEAPPPTAANCPLGHMGPTLVARASGQYLPPTITHGPEQLGVLTPGRPYSPGAQDLHVVAPASTLYFPAGQRVHEDAAGGLKYAAGHTPEHEGLVSPVVLPKAPPGMQE
jgi:hypothetical protein